MRRPEPYNPLDKINLARSIEGALLNQGAVPLADADRFTGAGVYVIYYSGGFRPYAPIAVRGIESNSPPIYIGKAIPKGGRKGGLTKDSSAGRALADRLRHHASSIAEVANLDLADFSVRVLVLDDVWIPLGENMLIETFKPVWNRAVDGFGNKDPGRRRATQFKSPWDILHPGRLFAEKLADSTLTAAMVLDRVEDHFEGRKLRKLPKLIALQQAEEDALEDLDSEEIEQEQE